MKSQQSSNMIRTIIRDNYKKYWALPALILLWLLLWGMIPGILAGSDWEPSLYSGMSFNLNFGYVTGLLALSVCSGMTVFSYLNNPGASNYMHSLPVSRGRLFAANYLSGLLMILGPILINGAAMTLMSSGILFIKWIIAACVSCFAMYSITVLAGMLSGNTLMHLFNALFINGVLSLILVLIPFMCDEMLFGYTTPEKLLTVAIHSNPVSAFIGTEVSRTLMCVIYAIVGIAALLAAWAVYRKRPIERTGSSLMFNWTRSILMIICVFCGAVLTGIMFASILQSGDRDVLRLDHIMLIGILGGALIVFIIGSLMIDRTVRIFTRKNVIPAAAAVALALAVTGALSFDVMGYTSYVPETSEVKAVYIDTSQSALFEYTSEDDMTLNFRGKANYYKADPELVREIDGTKVMGMTGDEAIDAARDMHQALIDQKRDYDWVTTVPILYELDSGKTIKRTFPIYIKDFEDGEYSVSNADEALLEAAGRFYDSAEFKEKYSIMNLRDRFFEKDTVQYIDMDGDQGEPLTTSVSKEDIPDLRQALEKDFQKYDYAESRGFTDYISIEPKDSEEDIVEIPVCDAGKYMKDYLRRH